MINSNYYARYVCVLLLLLFFGGSQTWAQTIDVYSFTQTAGAYTPITGGDVLFTAPFDDDVTDPLTIPAFNFAGTSHTEMYVSANGYITFGASGFTFLCLMLFQAIQAQSQHLDAI